MWFLLEACLHPPGPVLAPSPAAVVLVPVVASYAEHTVDPATPATREALADEVRAHALTVSDGAVDVAGFARLGDTADRLARIRTDPATPVVLVELSPRFSSQMAGRYRWTVDVALTLAVADDVHTETFAVPVALVYDHQREQAAADAAVPAVNRELRTLLDDWLARSVSATP